MEIDTRKEDYKNRVRRLLQGWMDNNSESIKSWSEGDATLDFRDLVLDVDDLEAFDYFVDKMYDKNWHAHDAYMFFRWSEEVDPRVPEDVGIRKMKEIEDRNNANQPVGLSENKRNKVKITKTHLKQLIKEERAKLLQEGPNHDGSESVGEQLRDWVLFEMAQQGFTGDFGIPKVMEAVIKAQNLTLEEAAILPDMISQFTGEIARSWLAGQSKRS